MQVRCKSTKIKTPCISTLRKLYLQVRISPSPPKRKGCTRVQPFLFGGTKFVFRQVKLLRNDISSVRIE